LRRRVEKGAGDAEDDEEAEDASDADRAGRGEGEEGEGGDAFGDLADRDDHPPVEAVGKRAGDEDEEERRRELDQADEAEIERVAGHVVDLPADRDADDQRGEGREHARQPEQTIAAMREGAGAGQDGRDTGHGMSVVRGGTAGGRASGRRNRRQPPSLSMNQRVS